MSHGGQRCDEVTEEEVSCPQYVEERPALRRLRGTENTTLPPSVSSLMASSIASRPVTSRS